MKKDKLFIIIGGILLMVGVVLVSFQKEKAVTYIYQEEKLSKDQAISLVKSVVKKVINIYEKQSETFKTNEMEDGIYLSVSNYKEVVNEVFSEKGLKEFEQIKFNDNLFIKKEEDNIYILKNIPKENSYIDSSIVVNIASINLKEITGKVIFTSSGLDDKNTLTYYVYEKSIRLIKDNDKWLIDTFIYNN